MSRFYEFDSFRINPEKRLLWRGEETVALKPKTFDTLLFLIENSGKTVSKDELVRAVWNGAAVTDDSLTKQISLLRKILDDTPQAHRFIITVPGVGYKFIGDVREVQTNNPNAGVAEVEPSAAKNANVTAFITTDAENSRNGKADFSPPENEQNFTARNGVARKKIGRRHNWRTIAAAVVFLFVSAATIYFWQRFYETKSAPLGVRSIAVLPFKTIGQDAETDGLKIGMADALITRLTRVEQINVLPTSRVSRFDKLDGDTLAAGRQLGVDAVLEGRIQRDGERLRVTAQLVKTSDGKTLWAENYEENFAGIFDVQTAVARKIAETLALELSDAEKRALMKRYTSSAEAYRLYLEAKYLHNKRAGGEARVLMQKNYQRAIELDPKFALAYVGLADMQTETPSRENYQKARILAEQALAIDDQLAEAHESLGFTLWRGEFAWSEAERHFRRAVELDPNSLPSVQSLAMILAWQNRFDEARQAVEAVPLKPDAPTAAEIAVSFYSRDYDRTIELALQRLEKRPNDVNALSFLAPAYTEKAMHAEAIEAAEKYAAFDHVVEQGGLIYLGFAYARAGEIEKAREILRRIEGQNAPPASAQINGALAFLLGALGERDKAFARLEKSIEAREFWAFTLKANPQFESLRGDSRFDELLSRMNLKEN
jgi:DNA-binding winged helix-turn-helix (wHTH) protein/TolB-like protein